MQKTTKRLLRKAYPMYRPILSRFGLLEYMARAHATDKIVHGYLKHYKVHFGPLRNRRLKILEIGVGMHGGAHGDGGGSLRMWRDYFPRAEIFSTDIVDKRHLQEKRIKIFQGSQNDPAFLDEFASRYGPFDIIIDDGSHVCEHIITSFRCFFPHLAAKGLYVVEDLFFSYDAGYGGSSVELNDSKTSLGMLKTLVDDVHFKYVQGRTPQSYGDQIVGITFYPKIRFIQKGDNGGPDAYVESYYQKSPEHRPHV